MPVRIVIESANGICHATNIWMEIEARWKDELPLSGGAGWSVTSIGLRSDYSYEDGMILE